MENLVAHDIESKHRTEDVKVDESITFSTMLLPDYILQGLKSVGFKKPSPIQLAAIPRSRCGLDLIVQAKSGTGKTLVFTITALESININIKRVQVIIIAPTREIAIQIADVIRSVGSAVKGLKVSVLVGGRPLGCDKVELQGTHIAVGSPGRLRHLIEQNILDSVAVRLLVLDESDKLFSEDNHFQKDITYIYNKCGDSKQVLALSATYPPSMLEFTQRFMRGGKHVTPSGGPTPVLLGLRQMVLITRDHPDYNVRMAAKEKELFCILETVSFDQCCIFHHYATRAESMNIVLRKKGFSSICLTSKQNMDERQEALSALKSNRCRILVTTDIAARGIDAASVNLIINMGLPWDPASYLHRMGRAGRYGSQGVCISLISGGLEVKKFQQILGQIGGTSMAVNIIPKDQKYDLWNDDLEDFNKLYGIVSTDEEENSQITLSFNEAECTRSSSAQENHEKTPLTNGIHKHKNHSAFSFKEIQEELDKFVEKEKEVKVGTPKKNTRKSSSPKQYVATYSEILCRPKKGKTPVKLNPAKVELKKQMASLLRNELLKNEVVSKEKNLVISTSKNEVISSEKNEILSTATKEVSTKKKEVLFKKLSPNAISSSESEEQGANADVSVLNESRINKRKRDNYNYSSSSSEFESDMDSYSLCSDETMYTVDEDSPSGVDLNADEDDFESLSVITSCDCPCNARSTCGLNCLTRNYYRSQTDWYFIISREISNYVMYCRQFQAK